MKTLRSADSHRRDLEQRIEKQKDQMELEILNQKNRLISLHQRDLDKIENTYQGQVRTVAEKVETMIQSKTQEINELREQLESRDYKISHLNNLMERQKQDFLIGSH